MITTRRQFLKSSGALVVYFALPGSGSAQYSSPNPGQSDPIHGNASVDTWIRIEAAGRVIISAGKVEFGQGIRTALAQIAAEELDIDLARIQMREVDTSYSPDESYTFSAISVQQSGTRVRNAAAHAKQLLLQLAAKTLSVPVIELAVKDGSVLHLDQPTTLDYWKILAHKSFNTTIPGRVAGKPQEQYQLVGRSVPRLDIPGKVFAQASYLADMRLPGMVHARVIRPQRPGLNLLSVETAIAASMQGVLKIVRDGSFLAVVAERELQATRAAAKLASACHWQAGHNLPEPGKLSSWLKSAEAVSSTSAEHRPANGATTGQAADINLAAEYSRPFLAHASIAPSAAIALWEHQKLTVWSHGQGMYPLRGAIAHALGLKNEQVRCIHAESGGVYGHNGADDAACDAAVIAMAVPGRAVKLQWSRADEFRHEPFGSAMTVSTRATLNRQGKIISWTQDVWSCTHSTRPAGSAGAGNFLYAQEKQSPFPAPPMRTISQPSGGADRNAVPLYAIPVLKVKKHLVKEMPLRVSALRGLGAYANVFAIESFMDELAAAANADPFKFRLAHLNDQRARFVLERLREISGWSKRPAAGTGQGWGIGFAKYKNLSAYLAVFINLTIDRDSNQIRLNSAQAVVDAGLVVNPDGVRAQIEGGIIQSASWTLKEQVRYAESGILSKDWASYPILRFDEVPDVDVEIVKRPDQPWLGVAEAAQGPTGAAIANAIFHASGKRLRHTPLAQHFGL